MFGEGQGLSLGVVDRWALGKKPVPWGEDEGGWVGVKGGPEDSTPKPLLAKDFNRCTRLVGSQRDG